MGLSVEGMRERCVAYYRPVVPLAVGQYTTSLRGPWRTDAQCANCRFVISASSIFLAGRLGAPWYRAVALSAQTSGLRYKLHPDWPVMNAVTPNMRTWSRTWKQLPIPTKSRTIQRGHFPWLEDNSTFSALIAGPGRRVHGLPNASWRPRRALLITNFCVFQQIRNTAFPFCCRAGRE